MGSSPLRKGRLQKRILKGNRGGKRRCHTHGDREVIHVLEQEFIVDEQDGIMDPLGMSGVRMEAKIHIVTGAVTSAQNIIKCANKAGLDVHDIVLESLASSEAILTDEERNLGVVLVDFGGGTTDMAVFSKGVHKAYFSAGPWQRG